jgi:ElaB/YqjD/DUF883 family membrane-anchored ribosome-binding protein
MERAMDDFDKAKGRIADDLQDVVSEGENMLKAAAKASGEGIAAARTKFDEGLATARSSLAHATQPIIDSTKKNVAIAEQYVHENPWTVIGIAAAAGMLVGLLAARR